MARRYITKAQLLARRERVADAKRQLANLESQVSDAKKAEILARFAGYSPRNAMLIAAQRPNATEVNSYNQWRQLGRQVRRGETGIMIFAPVPPRSQDPDMSKDPADESEERMRFRPVYVFDIEQTDPIDQPANAQLAEAGTSQNA